MKKIKLSLTSSDFASPSMPILLIGGVVENLQKAASLGADGLEVHIRETTRLDYDNIRNAMNMYGVGISCIVTGKLCTIGKVDLMDPRPYISKAAIEGFSQYTMMAKELNTDLVLGWLRGSVPNDGNREYYLNELARNLKTVCARAEEFSVRVFLEVINRYESNVFNTCKETLDFIEQYEIPNCLIHLDSYHMNIEEKDSAEAIRFAGKQLGYFHIADNTRHTPGSGNIDFRKQIKALDDIGYSGYVSVECLPGDDGYETAKNAITYLVNLLSE